MKIITVDNTKRKKALKSIQKQNLLKCGGAVKLCYFLTQALRALGVMLAALSAYDVWKRNGYAIEYSISFFVLLIPVAISFITAAIYTGKTSKDFLMREAEKIVQDQDHIEYSYKDRRFAGRLYSYSFEKASVKDLIYDEKTKVLVIKGTIIEDVYVRDQIQDTNEWGEITLVNTFSNYDLYDDIRN